MIIYDKARWQIEGGVSEKEVIAHFEFMFSWLKEYSLLNEYGKKFYSEGIDEESILTDEMVNDSGRKFLDKHYDTYIASIEYGAREDADKLQELYFSL